MQKWIAQESRIPIPELCYSYMAIYQVFELVIATVMAIISKF